MSEVIIKKDDINLDNILFKDTIFETLKTTNIGTDSINISKDTYFMYKFLLNGLDLNELIDYCMVDYEKIIIINSIMSYRAGLQIPLKILKNNKYFYLYIQEYLKDNKFTIDIINYYIDNKTIYYNNDCNNDTPLTYACHNKMRDVAIKLIDTFGDKVNPEHVNKNSNTALILACENNMTDVAIKLIDTFGDKVNPGQVNKNSNTALILACSNKMNNVAIKLIDTLVIKLIQDLLIMMVIQL